MAKCIRRVGIIFFALVISCLLIVGVTLSTNVASESFELDSNANNDIQNSADYSVTLTSSNQASKWNEAIQYSLDNGGVNVDVVLTANWTAASSSQYTTSFGEGVGFKDGRIMIPRGVTITLDLNNFSINRNLTSGLVEGNVIINYGSLHIKDNSIAGAGTITGGNIIDESSGNTRGGGVYNEYNATLTLSSGIITGNRAFCYGGGVFNNGFMAMYGGKISNNEVYGYPTGSSGGGINNVGTFLMYDGIISDNYCIYVGGGLMNSRNFEMYGGSIINNTAGRYGGGMRNDRESLIAGGIITNNTADVGGGVVYNNNTISIKAGAQIYGNKDTSGNENDLYFTSNAAQTKLIIVGNLCEDGKTTHIGITGEYHLYNSTFTSGYNQYNANVNPSRYFYSNETGKMIGSSSGEATFADGTNVKTTITWRWNGAGQGNTTASNATVQYNASKSYVIDIGGDSFYDEYGNLSNTKSVSEPGNYAFYTTKSCVNPTFMFTIKGGSIEAPNGINKTFTYSGEVIDCSSYINGFNSDKMNILNNTATQAGIYYALVAPKQGFNWLDGSNKVLLYEFVIEPKKINKPAIGNNTFVYSGSEITYVIDYNEELVQVTEIKATDIGKYKAKVSLKDNKNYAWEDGSTSELEYEYEIIHPGIVLKDSSKFDYIYFDNNYRKGYTENDLIHRVNDSEKTALESGNRYVIGNIPVNTTLTSFINNIRNESKLIKVYNNQGNKIFDGIESNGIIADSVSNTLVGTGYKVELYESTSVSTPWDIVYLSVLGDINGDGRITASDVAEAREVAENSTLLNSMPLEKKLACMVDNKGSVTYVDSEILRNTINNQLDINLFFESGVNIDSEYKYLTLDKDNLIRGTSETQTNVIGNIAVNTSVTTFKEKLAVLGIDTTAITIYDRKGTAVSDNNAIVGTGWSIETGGKTIYLSVIGDLNGDGRISATDITILRELVTKDITGIQDCILLSAIVLNKGGITTADSEVLRVVVNGILQINRY